MNVVVAGLSPREEAAFGFFMSRSMKGWSWQSTPAGRGTVLPKADLLVADMVALGLAQWSVAAEAELLRVLQGSTAVLLVPAHNQTWSEMDAAKVKQHALVWLARPYGSEAMREALEAAAALRRAAAPARPPPGAARPAPGATPAAAPPAPTAIASAQPVRPVRPVAAGAAETPDEVPGLSAAQLQARLAAVPEAGRHVFMRKLSAMLALGQPFEARFTVQNSVIFHPADGWVASNTPMMVIERVGLSDALAAAVMFREIDGAQAEERAQRLGMTMRELQTFLWELAAAALDRKTPPPAGARPL